GRAGPEEGLRIAGEIRDQAVQGGAILPAVQGLRLPDTRPQGPRRHLPPRVHRARRATPPDRRVPAPWLQGRRTGDLRLLAAVPRQGAGGDESVSGRGRLVRTDPWWNCAADRTIRSSTGTCWSRRRSSNSF